MLPVSTSVTLTRYSLMRPLRCSSGGGCQVTKMEVESTVEAIGFIGAAVGTAVDNNIYKHCCHCSE